MATTRPAAERPKDTLTWLIEKTGKPVVEVASREAGERVKATAANPGAFEVEQAEDGGWQVRYVGREA